MSLPESPPATSKAVAQYNDAVKSAGKGPPLIVLTADAFLLLASLIDRDADMDRLTVRATQLLGQAITTAALRMLDQTPDARQRISDEIARMEANGMLDDGVQS